MISKYLSNLSGGLREAVAAFLVVFMAAATIIIFKGGIRFGQYLWEKFHA